MQFFSRYWMIMPSRILIEADECTHELGKIIHNKPSEWNVQVEIVENTEVVKLVSSHIEYRLVFTVSCFAFFFFCRNRGIL